MTILELDDAFQKHLQEDHYSFVDPVNPFIKALNNIAPTGIFGTIHDTLSNRAAARQALNIF